MAKSYAICRCHHLTHLVHQIPVMKSQTELTLHVVQLHRRFAVPRINHKTASPRPPLHRCDRAESQLLQRIDPLRMEPFARKTLVTLALWLRLQQNHRPPSHSISPSHGTSCRPSPYHNHIGTFFHSICDEEFLAPIRLIPSKRDANCLQFIHGE